MFFPQIFIKIKKQIKKNRRLSKTKRKGRFYKKKKKTFCQGTASSEISLPRKNKAGHISFWSPPTYDSNLMIFAIFLAWFRAQPRLVAVKPALNYWNFSRSAGHLEEYTVVLMQCFVKMRSQATASDHNSQQTAIILSELAILQSTVSVIWWIIQFSIYLPIY